MPGSGCAVKRRSSGLSWAAAGPAVSASIAKRRQAEGRASGHRDSSGNVSGTPLRERCDVPPIRPPPSADDAQTGRWAAALSTGTGWERRPDRQPGRSLASKSCGPRGRRPSIAPEHLARSAAPFAPGPVVQDTRHRGPPGPVRQPMPRARPRSRRGRRIPGRSRRCRPRPRSTRAGCPAARSASMTSAGTAPYAPATASIASDPGRSPAR